MKHPALTRVMAVVLAIVCAVMLVSGAVGLGNAQNEYEQALEEHEKLTERIATFVELSEKLDGEDSYKLTMEKLDARQKKHDEEASQFRTDLAERTAKQGGYQQGADMLWEAKTQTDAAYKQYQNALIQFQAAEQQFNAKMAQLDALPGQAQGAAQACAMAQGITPVPPGDPVPEPTMPVAPTPPKEPIAPAEGATAEEIEQYNADKAKYDADCIDYQNKLAAYEAELAEYNTNKAAYDAYKAKADKYAADMNTINSALGGANAILSVLGMTATDLGQAQQMLAGVTADALAGVKAAAQKEFDAGKAKLEEAGNAVNNAKGKVDGGLEQIWYDLGKIADEEPELEETRQRLLAEAEQLEKDYEAAKVKKEDERKLASTRAALKNYDRIAELFAENDDLAACSEQYASELYSTLHDERFARIAIAVVELVGGALGFLCIAPAYEKSKSRFMLLAPAVATFACAAAAVVTALLMAFGMCYSALPALIFAPIYLLAAFPKNKLPAA